MSPTTEKPRVLVVDDNRDAASSLGMLLESAGYEVKTCFDGKTALGAVHGFDPDACILDINMPGMDGYELARRLRQKDPEHPPLLATVTAYEDYRHLSEAADAGFDLHFTKPADPADMLDQIGDSVRKLSEERRRARAVPKTEAPAAESSPVPTAGTGRWLVVAVVVVVAVALPALLIWRAA